MMKKTFAILFFIFHFLCFSQTIKKIDSINNISFEVKLEKASVLQDVFLTNALNSSKINYKLGEAESFSNLALVNYYQGNFKNDLLYSLKSITIFEKIGATEKLAIQYGELGYRMKKRNITKALYYLQKAKSISESNNYQKALLSIYNNYGVLKEIQLQYDSAFYFYYTGLFIKESQKDSIGIPYSLNNIAGLYVIKKQYDKAINLYDKSLKIRILKNDQVGIAENYSYLGDLYTNQKQNEKAIFNYKIALEKALKFKYLDLTQYCYEMLSKNYESINDKNAALINYKLFTIYKDSILNKDTNSKIAELDIKFETTKKEKQLLQQEIDAKNSRNKLIFVTALSFFIGLIGFLIYRQQKLKNKQLEQEFQLKTAISQIETQNKLHEQRLSISRDLHDNIGAQLTFVISSVDNLKFGNQIKEDKIVNQLTKISDFTKSTIIELRDTIWAMNSNEFTYEDLHTRILNFIEKAKSAKDSINFKFQISDDLKEIKFSSVIGINLYRTIQEAINNAIKYSDANTILVDVSKDNTKIKILIQDNGKGFDFETIDFGNGLYNMKKRIEEVNGTFDIQSKINDGTTITILLNQNQNS